MVEKVIKLEDVSLVDILGIQNSHLKEIRKSFPNSKVISRGDEIRIQGTNPEIIKINEVFNMIIEHWRRYGKISLEEVKAYLEDDTFLLDQNPSEDIILFARHDDKQTPIKARTPNQQELVNSAGKNDVVFAVGPAGTGKTYIAVALAIKALRNKQVKRIIITRPAVEAGENLGFLPGDMQEKIDPYLRPIYDALQDMIGIERLKNYQERGVIEIAPIAYMRGRTLSSAFVLIDEAQNTTPMQLKMLLTRLGKNSKMIITGDISQIDLPKKVKSGLVDAYHLLKNISGIGIVKLEAKDVVRHKLVKKIIEAYEKQHNPFKETAKKDKPKTPKDTQETTSKPDVSTHDNDTNQNA